MTEDKVIDKKPIPEFEGIYEIHSNGLIWSFAVDRYLVPPKSNKYYFRTLYKDGHKKYTAVHQLVAKAFLPNPEKKRCVNHKNGIKNDNRVENLEWATYSENTIHAFDNGLRVMPKCKSSWNYGRKDEGCSKPVNQIDKNTGKIIASFKSIRSAAKKVKVIETAIANCIRGDSKTSAGYKWEYIQKLKTK